MLDWSTRPRRSHLSSAFWSSGRKSFTVKRDLDSDAGRVPVSRDLAKLARGNADQAAPETFFFGCDGRWSPNLSPLNKHLAVPIGASDLY